MAVVGRSRSEQEDDSYQRGGYFSNAVDKSRLKPGDHIYVYRHLRAYTHHGIYVGERRCEVIHFSTVCKGETCGKLQVTGKLVAKVQKTSLKKFCLDGSAVRLITYGCSSWLKPIWIDKSGFVPKSKPAEQVIRVAKYFLKNPNEWKKYHVETNNCNHFAYFCKTGEWLNAGGEGLLRNLFPPIAFIDDVYHAMYPTN